MSSVAFSDEISPTAVRTPYHAQGKRYFPCMVSVVESKTGKPILKAKIKLELDRRLLLSHSYEKSKLGEPSRTIEKNLYKVQQTNGQGLAALHYLAKFSDHSGAVFIYRSGVIIIDAEGFKPQRIDLRTYKPTHKCGLSDIMNVAVKLEKKAEPQR